MFNYHFDIILDQYEADILGATHRFNVRVQLTELENENGHQEMRVWSENKDDIIRFIMWFHGEDREQAEGWFNEYGGVE